MLNRPTAKNQHRCRPCLKKKQRRCSKFRRISNDNERWQIPNHLTMGWHQFWWSIVTFHTIFSQFLFYTSHKFNPNSSYLVRKQAGCGKEWWTMWKIPTQFKTGWDPFWRSILIFSWTNFPIIIALKPFLLLWKKLKWQMWKLFDICKCDFFAIGGANWNKINLQTCKLQTGWSISL